jgi:hypothetical protein
MVIGASRNPATHLPGIGMDDPRNVIRGPTFNLVIICPEIELLGYGLMTSEWETASKKNQDEYSNCEVDKL